MKALVYLIGFCCAAPTIWLLAFAVVRFREWRQEWRYGLRALRKPVDKEIAP